MGEASMQPVESLEGVVCVDVASFGGRSSRSVGGASRLRVVLAGVCVEG